MAAVGALLTALGLSLLVTRIGAMALILTGMSREAARFQARSAFSGVGYTTREAETILEHPVRRRIVMLLMLLSNLGVATVVATTILSFMQAADSTHWYSYLLLLVSGVLLLWLLARSRWVERHLNGLIAFGLTRWAHLEVRDYIAILQLEDGFAVTELLVEPRDWLANRTLLDLKLPQEGVLILGIRREQGAYLGTPTADMVVRSGDTLVLYGPIERIEELDQRRRGYQGDRAHHEAVVEHDEDIEEQVQIDVQLDEQRSRDGASS